MLVSGKDTSLNVSLSDIRLYNHAIADLKACNELADSLWSERRTQLLIASDDARYLVNAEKQIENLTSQVQEKTIVGDLSNKQLKRSERQRKVLKIGFVSISIVAILEAGWIGVQSLNK